MQRTLLSSRPGRPLAVYRFQALGVEVEQVETTGAMAGPAAQYQHQQQQGDRLGRVGKVHGRRIEQLPVELSLMPEAA